MKTAVELFNQQQFFHCHEVLEEAWMQAKAPRRLFLQSLIHLAVGMYHWQRGNRPGATGQLRKGLHKLTPYLPTYEGIDTEGLYQDATDALTRIEAGAEGLAFPCIHFTVS
jgi:predicted metal-dependent hydrolase